MGGARGGPRGPLGHSPGLLADAADPDLLVLLVGAAALADVERAVPTAALGVDEEGEGRAAAHAAVLHELLVLGEDAALAAFLVQLLLHLARTGRHGRRGPGQGAHSPGHPHPGPSTDQATWRPFTHH